ncbi:olfactory receptor 10A5-like [Tachyglossus aculeatus]|uniref:olfactory receptor 10A5-like n=1 Tax=Tachyglossus aculeatus TaxID=9261 RepID=UPI0018F5243B|nr:olfactory receptor 10A5-like [Tachyglossus aculeatus]
MGIFHVAKKHFLVEKNLNSVIVRNMSTEPMCMCVILFMIFLVIHLIALIGNSLLVLVPVADPTLKTPKYSFFRSLSFIDFCYTTVFILKMLTNFLSKYKSISFGGCVAQIYFAFFPGPSECWILTMPYDRKAAICDPLHYSFIMNQRLCLQLALASWLAGIPAATVQTTMMFTLSFCGPNVINHFFCDGPPPLELLCTDTFTFEVYGVTGTVIALMLPYGVIIASYVCILINILKMPPAKTITKPSPPACPTSLWSHCSSGLRF